MNTHPTLLKILDSVLVVVDMQGKLSAVMAENDATLMHENTVSLLEAAKKLAIPVLVTEQYPQGLGQIETQVSDALPDTAQIFEKTSFSCTGASGFMPALKETASKQIILVGQEAHVCILQTALDLITLGYQVHVVEDAICARKAEHKFYALQRLQAQNVIITNYESVLFEWLRDAAHPDFKTISQLLR
ncbi:MAG: isochorismatase family protein [Methylococcales bacterium]|nr:isochorismatase family protein [Methylococcales bacterium]MDD5754625.1 isochorismatase family protein [Methylococcales bacterium]